MLVSAPRTLRHTVVADSGRLESLSGPWLDLLGRSGDNRVMLTPLWLLPWWRTWGPLEGRQLRVVLFHEDERLVGLVPLLGRRWRYGPGLSFRRLEPLGVGEPSGEHVCSDYLTAVAEPGYEEGVAAGLARVVCGGGLGAWDELVWPRMDAERPMPQRLAAAFRQEGWAAACEPDGEAPYIPLPGTYEQYLKALSSSRRYFISRSVRRFEAWAGAPVEVHVAANPAELEAGQRLLIALHAGRWQAAGQAGVFAAERVRAFHDVAQRGLLAAGALELLWLRAGAEPVAAFYNLIWQGALSFYQSGRRMDLPGDVRPGVALHAYAIRRAIEAGLREYDFLAGTSRYKSQFALAARPLVALRAVRPGIRERARQFAQAGVRGTRRLARHVRGWWRRPARPTQEDL